jgi:starch synthase
MIFFARGVIETVRKLRWSPDIIHCHGWFTSLLPLYIKRSYNEEPLFMNSKVIFSAYDEPFNEVMSDDFAKKVKFEGITKEDMEQLNDPSFLNLAKLTLANCDGVIRGSEKFRPEIEKILKNLKIPVLKYQASEDYIDAYSVFYDTILTR